MDSGFLSRIQVDSVKVSACSLWTNPEAPTGPLATDTNIELSNPEIQKNPVDGSLFSVMTMGATVSYSDEDQERTPRAKLSVKLTGRVTAQPGTVLDDHDTRVAAASQLYPQLQPYLSILGGMAQMTGVLVPTIDADALVATLEIATPGTTD